MSNFVPIKLNNAISLLRLTSFDVSTEAGRSSERHRRILLSAVASGLAKTVAVGTALISIPLTLHYLGAERFGLWMTISSVIAMLSFADLGIGNGLLNSIAEADGKDDYQAICQYISSAFAILTVIALAMQLLFYLIYPFVPWPDFFNVKLPLATREAGSAIAVFVLCFTLSIPLGVVQRTQMGLQMGFVANLWQMAGSLLGLGGVLLAIHFEAGLPWLVGGMAGGPVLVAVMNGLLFFGKVRPDIRPNWRYIRRGAMKKIAHTGFLFLILQTAMSLVFASDNIVISRVLGAEAVTQYAVPEKMFSIIPALLGMVILPLWPAYGEAIARGDGQWIKRIFARSLVTAVAIATVAASTLVFFAKEILGFWTGHEIQPSMLLLLGMGLWRVAEACGSAVAMFLNGANIVRAQVSICILLVLCAVPLKVLLVQDIGVAGAVWGTVIAYVSCALLPYALLVPNILKRITRKAPTAMNND